MRVGKVIDGVPCVGLILNGKRVWFELTWVAEVKERAKRRGDILVTV